MKGLLILLTSVAILGAIFAGGCSVWSVGEYLWNGPRREHPDLERFIAQVSAGVGLAAAAVLAANLWVLGSLRGRPTRWRRTLACGLSLADILCAVAALAWILWGDTWGWADWTWSWLAKAGAVALGVKGVLVGRLVGRAGATHTTGAGDP